VLRTDKGLSGLSDHVEKVEREAAMAYFPRALEEAGLFSVGLFEAG
jgi:hypothetical protein